MAYDKQDEVTTLALGKVLSTTAGVYMLTELFELSERTTWDYKYLREYERGHTSKRATKEHERLTRIYTETNFNRYGILRTLAALVCEASDFASDIVDAIQTVEYEIQQMRSCEMSYKIQALNLQLDDIFYPVY